MGLAKPVWPVLQRGSPLAQGLVAGWPFSEGSGGAIYDLSGNQLNGTLTAAPWVGSPFGSALNFVAASNANASISGSLNEVPQWTMAAWVKLTSLPASSAAAIIGHADAVTAAAAWSSVLGITSSGGIDGYFFNGSPQHVLGTTAIATGAWRFVAVSMDSTNNVYRAYLDGKDDTASAPSTSTGPSANVTGLAMAFTTGGFAPNDFTQRLDAIVADVKIWKRALSAADIAMLYFDSFSIYRSRSRPGTLSSIAGATALSRDAKGMTDISARLIRGFASRNTRWL
jgi:hypothetical protein